MFQQSEVRFGLITCLRSSENTCFSPQLCVGFLFLILYPGSLPAASSFRLLLSDTPHLCHTQLCHILSFTHHLSHMSHTILSHTIGSLPSLPHSILQPPILPPPSCQSHTIFVTYQRVAPVTPPTPPASSSHLHLVSHTPSLSHTTLSHTIFYTLCGRFAWQAWHLGDIHLGFTWPAWHNLTSTVVLRGRRGRRGTW